ncbi:MAG: alkaline phosphatase family protein, partial [Acidobacteriota bacterium]|nr:alkaline phosphatase family protein [Acidobacteriota bacterium]
MLTRRQPRRRAIAIALGASLLVAGCGGETDTAPEPPASPPVRADGPRLVLVIAIDQFAYEYVDRFDPFFRGGLRRLFDDGIFFTDANFDHALTVTAAGHTALVTGLHPSSSGIVNNTWYDRASRGPMYSFADRDHGRSPVNLRGTGLADWIKARDPGSKAYSASQKDRSAIAMAGHAGDAAFWYDASTGGFETSSYYPEHEPAWLEAFRERRLLDRHFASGWKPLPLSDADVTRLGLYDRNEGLLQRHFPYVLGGRALEPGPSFFDDLRATPFSDGQVLSFAQELIREEALGQREHLDYLAIGLSALDFVGHSFGPRSREAADVLLRMDGELDRFFEFLDQTVGLHRVVMLVSADHGVAPVPEISAALGEPGHRASYEDDACFQRAGLRVAEGLGIEGFIMTSLYVDRSAVEAAGVEVPDVEAALAKELEKCDIVERAWTASELASSPSDEPDHFRRLFRHSFDPERSADVMLQLTEFSLPASRTFTTHGSPYSYDTHVPLILLLPGVAGVKVADP